MSIFIREIFSSLRISNPFVDLDDEDDNIFKPGGSFSDVFNSFMN